MTERHPTYFEARDAYQRLADMLPLVDKLCFVAEHGEVVNLGRVVRDALSEMFRLHQIAEPSEVNALRAGTHVIVPKEVSEAMLEVWLDNGRTSDLSGTQYRCPDWEARRKCERDWHGMIEAAQEKS